MSVEQEIKNGATRFEAAFNQRDAAALAADYAEDALLLPPEISGTFTSMPCWPTKPSMSIGCARN